jgi:putative endonuclease
MADLDEHWSLYIVRCADGTLYTGITCDLARRLTQHNLGRGAKYTRGRAPVALAYVETFVDRSMASKREYVVKQMTLEQKRHLIASYKGSAILAGDQAQG